LFLLLLLLLRVCLLLLLLRFTFVVRALGFLLINFIRTERERKKEFVSTSAREYRRGAALFSRRALLNPPQSTRKARETRIEFKNHHPPTHTKRSSKNNNNNNDDNATKNKNENIK